MVSIKPRVFWIVCAIIFTICSTLVTVIRTIPCFVVNHSASSCVTTTATPFSRTVAKDGTTATTTTIYKDAIVYLTGARHVYRPERTTCPSLLESIKSLDRHLPRHPSSNITLILMSDETLDLETQSKIRDVSPFPVEFQNNINLAHPELEKPDTDNLLYKRMCAFWFYYFFKLPFLPDYVMRMDTDSCLTSDMPSNPFQAMRKHRLDYMWYSTFIEPGDVIEELRDFSRNHPLSAQSHPSLNVDHDHEIDLLWENDPSKPSPLMRVFSTNIEWFHMPAFLNRHILEWKESVLKDGGIYDHRWGDAPLRTVVATRFLNASAVGRFCNFSYVHSIWEPFKPCDPSSEIHAWPARQGNRKFAWKQVG